MIAAVIITEIRRIEREDRILAECDALDLALAEAFAFDEASGAFAFDTEECADEDAELRKAALSRGQT
jgi:hypothetical protein